MGIATMLTRLLCIKAESSRLAGQIAGLARTTAGHAFGVRREEFA
jgi:hypothetical protein